MPNRELLMLAHTLDAERHGVGGWWWSEKLDGMRAYWDGGLTRGLLKAQVPFANTKKDERYKVPPKATGLWSRYGNVIHAPDWWLDKLPKVPLDGELMMPGHRQDLMSVVKDINPSTDWVDVMYFVFDSPPPAVIYDDGKINNPNFSKRFARILDWYKNEVDEEFKPIWYAGTMTPYRTVYKKLDKLLEGNEIAELIIQSELVMHTSEAEATLREHLDRITNDGGEGIMVRNPNLPYQCVRSHHLLKMKKLSDMEGKVIGYVTGRETDKGSKLLGLMGALVLKLESGARMELSGFTDEERRLTINNTTDEAIAVFDTLTPAEMELPDNQVNQRIAYAWAWEHPEMEVPDWIEGLYFKRGDKITFKYRGKTKDGIPQEAAYWRKR